MRRMKEEECGTEGDSEDTMSTTEEQGQDTRRHKRDD